MDFRILSETPELLAVDKPPGLLVHPTKPGGPRTLLDGLRELLAYEATNGGHIAIINRLDRETSGVVLIAKTLPAARRCVAEMEGRRTHKEYIAVCLGWPECESFVIDAPLVRLGSIGPSRVWLRRGVHPQGQHALTEFQTLARWLSPDGRKFSLLRALPKTGRTHQIRVHLAEAGFPIVGDKLYADGEDWYLRFIETGWTPELQAALLSPHHLLHATRLRIAGDSQTHDFVSPPGRLLRFAVSTGLPPAFQILSPGGVEPPSEL